MKKSIFAAFLIMLTVVFTLSMASCLDGGKSLNSAEELKAYLDSQPANTPDKPIKVTMKADVPMRSKIADVLRDTDKYVSLNLTGKELTTIKETDATADWESDVESGTVRYLDLNMDRTLKEETNKKTGVTEKIVVKSLTEALQPRISIFNDEDQIITTYIFGNNSVIYVNDGQRVKKGEQLAMSVYLLNIIDAEAFKNCTSLTSITIPKGETRIGDYAFYNCKNLTSVTIPSGVTSIEQETFADCTSLTSVTIPNSVTIIFYKAFYDCTSLTSVTFKRADTHTVGFCFSGDLGKKYGDGGIGTYTVTEKYDNGHPKTWTKQPDSSNKNVSSGKSSGKLSAFPGRWRLIEGDGDAKNVELFKDGTGTADGSGITWKVENGRFHILHPFYTFSAYYNVTGSTVTFTQDDGEVIKYQKK